MKKYRATMDGLRDLINKPVKTETRKDAKLLYYHAAENEIARFYNSGNDEELITLYLSNRERFSENIHPDKLLLVARAFLHKGRYGEAVSTFLGISPFDLNKKSKGTYYYHLARAYVGNGDTQKALKLLEEGRKENMEKYDRQRLTVLLADLYREEGLLEKAYGLYGSVVEVKTEIPAREIAEVYLSMGMILNDQGKYEKAKTILSRCLKLADPGGEQQDLIKSAYMELGRIFHAEGDFKRAVEALERGFKLGYGPDEPDYWENRFKLALSYNGIGEAARAEDLLYEIMEEGDATLQQRAQIKLGAIGLNRQLKQLPLGRDRQMARKNDE
jgi:tetratricopeptide (TPR) repeat protein